MVMKMATPKQLQELDEIYAEVREHAAAYYLPHSFESRGEKLSLCWRGRVARAQEIAAAESDNEKTVAGYKILCDNADIYFNNANLAIEKYKRLCNELGQTPKGLAGPQTCRCEFCTAHNAAIDRQPIWAAERAIQYHIYEFFRTNADGVPLAMNGKGEQLFKELIARMQTYADECERLNQKPDWLGIANGSTRSLFQ